MMMILLNVVDWLVGLSRTLAKINFGYLILTGGVLLMLVKILWRSSKRRGLRKNGVSAQGIIVGKRRAMVTGEFRFYRSGKLYRIKFVDGNGKEFIVDHFAPAILYKEGDVVQVLYDAADPYDFMVV